jgi:hypothetical protein
MLPNFTHIRSLIAASQMLTPQEKELLGTRLVTLRKVELLRVEKSLELGSVSGVRTILARFVPPPVADAVPPAPLATLEVPPKPLVIEPAVPEVRVLEPEPVVVKDAPNVAWTSMITDIAFTGELVVPLSAAESHPSSIAPLDAVHNLDDPRQILLLEPRHVSFGLQDNPDRSMYRFVQSLTKLIAKNHSLTTKRSLLMSYLKSPLFYAYISTGLVGIQVKYHHNKVALNKISEENSKYLNAKQFKYAAILTSEIRGLCAL